MDQYLKKSSTFKCNEHKKTGDHIIAHSALTEGFLLAFVCL